MSKKQQTKTVPLTKKQEKDDSSEESEQPAQTKSTPVAPVKVVKDKSESGSESEDEKPKKTSDKGTVPPAKNAPAKGTTKTLKPKEESEDDESSEVFSPNKSKNGNGNGTTNGDKKTTTAKPPVDKKAKEESSEESDEEEVKPPVDKKAPQTKKTQAPPVKQTTQAKKKETSEESEDEMPKVTEKKEKKKTGDSSEESESEELHIVKPEDKVVTNGNGGIKRKREPEKDTQSKKPKVNTEGGGGGNTKVRLGNLSFDLDGNEEEIKTLFADCGTIKSVELIKRQDGRFAGVAIIEFGTEAEANKALEKHDEEFYGRKMNLSFAKDPKFSGTGAGKSRGPSEKPEGCTTVFIGNLSYQVTEEEVRAFFSECGKISDIRWPKGDFTGIGWVEFEDTSSTDEAVKLAGQSLAGRNIRVDFAAPRKQQNSNW